MESYKYSQDNNMGEHNLEIISRYLKTFFVNTIIVFSISLALHFLAIFMIKGDEPNSTRGLIQVINTVLGGIVLFLAANSLGFYLTLILTLKRQEGYQKQKASWEEKIIMAVITYGTPIVIVVFTSLGAAFQGESFQESVGRFAFVFFVWICTGIFLVLAFTGKLKGKPKEQGQQKPKQKRKPK